MLISIALIISILTGQLIKFPLFGVQGPTLLDLLIFLLCIIGSFKVKFKLKSPPLYIRLALLFILIATLSLIFTPLHLKLEEYVISFSYTVRFFLYIYLGWIISSDVFPSFKKQISKTLLISGVGLAILGLLQLIFFPNLQFLQNLGWDPHYFRTVSTFLDPNFAGAYFSLTFLLVMSLRARRAWQSILFLSLVYIALLTTFSRSSYLMFLISGLAYAILQKSKKTAFFIVVLFLGLLLGFKTYSHIVAKPRGISREQSASFRLDTWQQGLTIFQKSPIFGVGFNSYKYALREYNLADFQFLDSRGATTNDSSFLYILSTTGILGLLTYLLFLFSIMNKFFPSEIKSGVKNNITLVAGLIGLMPHSLFANSLFYPFILIWILLKASDTKN